MILSLLIACGTGSVTLDAALSAPCADGFVLAEDGYCYPETDDTGTDPDSGSETGGETDDSGETGTDTDSGSETGETRDDSGSETGEDTETGGETGDDTGEPEEVDPGAYNELDVVTVDVGVVHYCAMDSWGYVNCVADGLPELEVPADLLPERFVDVAASNYYSCGILDDGLGTVECWGDAASYGTVPSSYFVAIDSMATNLSTLVDFSCGVTTSGAVECWGEDVPAEVASAPTSDVSDLCVGGYGGMSFLCTQSDTDGAVSCMNMGLDASLDSAASSGRIVEGSLTCGGSQSCGILADEFGVSTGEIDCWGMAGDGWGTVGGPFTGADDDDVGEIGYSDTTSSSFFVSVTASHFWNCAADSDGYYGCFGNAVSMGSDPNGEILTVSNVVINADLNDALFTYVSAGEGGGCGVDTQDGAWEVNCWGDYYGW